MKRFVFKGCAAVALGLGLAGCGGSVETGAPKDLTPAVPANDPTMNPEMRPKGAPAPAPKPTEPGK